MKTHIKYIIMQFNYLLVYIFIDIQIMLIIVYELITILNNNILFKLIKIQRFILYKYL